MRRGYKGIPINTSENTHEKVFEMILGNKEIKIVDLPCGAGAFVLRLQDYGYKNILAMDIENILQIGQVNFQTGDMTKTLPLENNSIDCLVCIDGIEHISQQFNFVKEVNRVLKEGGEIIISTPNISSIRSRWKWFTSGHHHKCNSPLDESNPNPLHHIGMISFPEIRYLLHTNGFVIKEVTTNRIKMISWIYLLWVPLIYIVTSWVYFRSGKKEGKAGINREIKKQMFSISTLFGETMIVKGVKKTRE